MLNKSTLTIKTLLVFIIGLLTAVVVCLGSYGFFSAKGMRDNMVDIYTNRVVCMDQIRTVNNAHYSDVNVVRNVLAGKLSAEDALSQIDDNEAKSKEKWKAYMDTYLLPEEKIIADSVVERLSAFSRPLEDVRHDLGSGDKAKLAESVEELAAINDILGDSLDQLFSFQAKIADQQYQQSESNYGRLLRACSQSC